MSILGQRLRRQASRQRVLLARALYRRPTVLILDEGTANLDLDTETAIADIVASLPITRIAVAHRPALIDRVSRVLRIANGAASEMDSIADMTSSLIYREPPERHTNRLV